ncbi:MAG: hypothetical protein LBF33_02430 [Oscillospiraceae bacterium]|nr:hypothetical protein [Oscillospiraceae bacterium]
MIYLQNNIGSTRSLDKNPQTPLFSSILSWGRKNRDFPGLLSPLLNLSELREMIRLENQLRENYEYRENTKYYCHLAAFILEIGKINSEHLELLHLVDADFLSFDLLNEVLSSRPAKTPLSLEKKISRGRSRYFEKMLVKGNFRVSLKVFVRNSKTIR